jgi:SAM-dependent methyltransferase
MVAAVQPERASAYGQGRPPTIVDRFGVWLGARAVRRNVRFEQARFADFGCGYNATFARTQLAVASSALLVDVALAPDLKRHPKVTAVEGSLPDVVRSVPDGSLDVVLCLSVLEHLWEPQVVLDHFHRVLAPRGVLVLNVPSWLGKPFLEYAAFRVGVSPAEEMDDHKSYYDPRDLWPMLIRAGFRPSLIRCHRHKFGLNTSAVCRTPDQELIA